MATETLSSMGLSVEGAVKQAASHRDPEVRIRARQILRVIRHADRQRLINAFIAGADVADDAGLPGWSAFQEIAGNDDNARKLYVQLLEDEWEFLDAVYQSEPPVASSLVAGRIIALDLASRRKPPVTVGNIASLLLVASRDQVELTNQAANLMSLCYRSSDFEAAIRNGPSRDALRALLGRVIAGGAGNSADPYLTQRFHFSLYYDLKEGLEPARQVLREGLGIPHVRQYALLVLGKLGETQDETIIESLLNDPSVIISSRVNRQRIETQVRDVALAVLVHRRGGKFQEYGMTDVKPHPTTFLQLATVGFANDQQREQAIAAWTQRHAAKVTPTTDDTPPTPKTQADEVRRLEADPVDRPLPHGQ
jgi:hypothetical protein